MSRTPQQKIGDRLEQAALEAALDYHSDARLTKGSGSLNQDGDISGIGDLHVECKNSEAYGKGRSISKKDWAKIKKQARKRCQIPVHLGYDDDGEIVALIPWDDLVTYVME